MWESRSSTAAWSFRNLIRSPRSVLVLVVFLISLLLSQVIACNIHELAHAAVGSMLGWQVDSIQWCAPGGGSVTFSHVGTWAGNLQGYAGGVVAAGFLYIGYWRFLAVADRPLRTPEWWAVGAGMVLWIGPQLVIATLEGSAGPGEDYTDLFVRHGQVLIPVVVLSALLGVTAYVRRWRSVFER